MLTAILDSYMSYVEKRLQAIGAAVTINGVSVPQPVGGIMDARDWPQTEIVEGALYLLLQRAVPLGRQSRVQRQYTYYCQWVWLLIGTDIGGGQRAANRGDRYRQSMQIANNLKEANYPGYCQKMVYSADAAGVVTGVPAASTYPVSATEWIYWEDLRFMPRTDAEKSGVDYGAATVEVAGYEDMQSAAAITQADVSGAQVIA